MQNQSRREFFRQARGVAAAGTVMCCPRTSQAAANAKVNVGFVGSAGRAGSLVSLFTAQPDVHVVAVADVDQARMPASIKRIEQQQGKRPKTFQDFRHLLDDPSIDVIVVGTPDHWHAIPTILACQAEKDVYVEKPDGHNMLEGQRMVQAMQRHRRVVQLGTQARSSKHFQTAISFIRSGRLGRVLVAKAWESARQGALGNPPDSEPPTSVDYDMWLGPAPKRPFNRMRFHGNWRWFFDYGTGDLGNDGVHRIDVARWALATAVLAETGKEMSALPHFLDCVKSRQRPNADLQLVGHPSSVMCHAGNVAWRTGKKLVIDPRTELFDDDEANQLRSRSVYRKPWVLPEVT